MAFGGGPYGSLRCPNGVGRVHRGPYGAGKGSMGPGEIPTGPKGILMGLGGFLWGCGAPYGSRAPHPPEKHSVNSCSSLVARSRAFRACSSVTRLLISLQQQEGGGVRPRPQPINPRPQHGRPRPRAAIPRPPATSPAHHPSVPAHQPKSCLTCRPRPRALSHAPCT